MATRNRKVRAEHAPEEYADITVGTWYNLTQVKEMLGIGRGQVQVLTDNGVLHPKLTRVNRKIKVVPEAEVEEARKQLDAIKALTAHMSPARNPQARYVQPAMA